MISNEIAIIFAPGFFIPKNRNMLNVIALNTTLFEGMKASGDYPKIQTRILDRSNMYY